MACLVAEIVMIVCGILALVRGRITVTGNRVVEGVPARIIGVIFLLPIPLAFVAGVFIGIILAAQGKEVNMQNMQPMASILEAVIFSVCFFAALGVSFATGKPPRPKRVFEDEIGFDDDEDTQSAPRPPDERFQE